MSDVPLSQRPTTEQLERIRVLSNVIYGNPGLAFKQHGHPQTRQEASDLLKTLDGKREWAGDGEETNVDTKTCTKCGEEKPLDEFYKNHGRCKPCFREAQKERNRAKAGKTSKPPATVTSAPAPPAAEEPDWRDAWADPRVSQLEALREVLGAPTLGAALKAARRIAGPQ